MFHFLSKIIVSIAVTVSSIFIVDSKEAAPMSAAVILSSPQATATTPIVTVGPILAPLPTIVPTPMPIITPVSHLLDDPDIADFLTSQSQSIQVIRGVIQKQQNNMSAEQRWITSANTSLPTMGTYAQLLTPLIQDGQEYIGLIQSSIASGNKLIQIRQKIITALQNDDSQTLLDYEKILPAQTAIFTGLGNQINQLATKIYTEKQNLTNLIAGQVISSSTPILTPIPAPSPIITPTPTPRPTPVPVYIPTPVPTPDACQQIRSNPNFSQTLKTRRLAAGGCSLNAYEESWLYK